MMRPSDPRFRQTINQISHNLESANETAQEGIYTFSHNYIGPCFAGIKNGIQSCTAACFPSREDQLRRRRRGRSSVRAEFDFDFYDDWDYDEDATGDGLLGWGTDELDRLLAGSGAARSSAEQPRSHRRMSYGARGGRRKSAALPNDERRDPTVIPSSSFLGFLERFPWRIGARGIRYRPSAADLQENPGGARRNVMESEPLIEGSDESDMDGSKDDEGLRATKTRLRSGTQSSRETSNSLSSRGDLLPSDDEEDAVPLDDEFTMTLGRRDTGGSGIHDPPPTSRSASGTSMKTTESSKDSRTSRKGKGKRRRNSRRTISSKSPKSPVSDGEMIETTQIPSILDLKREEEQARYEEEMEIERKRQAAQRLARERGLSVNEDNREPENENNDTPQDPQHEQQQQQQSDDTTHETPSTTVKEPRTSTEQALQSPDLDNSPEPSDNRDTLDQES
ncbi:hypothetical protein EMPG_13514 [Blastomyces silverae]|uniref:Uncharacterized protein n=1 Tax=Blastomyces silverae TaxID=2060906 RepID=A0A0H1BI48_9EURO|nr:hypothetical protein EMPG_13514 [Blastomyces silverae]